MHQHYDARFQLELTNLEQQTSSWTLLPRLCYQKRGSYSSNLQSKFHSPLGPSIISKPEQPSSVHAPQEVSYEPLWHSSEARFHLRHVVSKGQFSIYISGFVV